MSDSDGSGAELDYAFASDGTAPGALGADVTECMSCADDVTYGATDCDGPTGDVPKSRSGRSVSRYCCVDSVRSATALAMASAEQTAEPFGKIARNDGTGSYRSLHSCRAPDISLFCTIREMTCN